MQRHKSVREAYEIRLGGRLSIVMPRKVAAELKKDVQRFVVAHADSMRACDWATNSKAPKNGRRSVIHFPAEGGDDAAIKADIAADIASCERFEAMPVLYTSETKRADVEWLCDLLTYGEITAK